MSSSERSELPSGPLPRILAVQSASGPGRSRLAELEEWLEAARGRGAVVYRLDCGFDRGGVWAGVSDLVRELLPAVERSAPELVERHGGELILALPHLRRTLKVRNPTLTEVAIPEEKVRNYPMDRAYRVVHGLIDFVTGARRAAGQEGTPWILVCLGFSQAGALARRFFRELLRRKGGTGLTLVLEVEPGYAPAEDFPDEQDILQVCLEDSGTPEPAPDPGEMARLAEELERKVQQDPIEISTHLQALIHLWENSSHPERALVWKGLAFGEYNHYGFYEDALRYGRAVLENLDSIIRSTRLFTRWNLVGALANCHLALKQPEQAREIVEREGLAKVEDPGDRSRIFYVLALIHSRFMPAPDMDLAESYIDRGLAALAASALPDHERYFLQVFLHNGLAFIRHRQGRPEEALRLCHEGFETLETHLASGQHRLHRSVLLYNIAQVHAALRQPDKAIEYYTAALTYDPNYSEYHNERGNAYLSLGRLEEAIADYRIAIELSPPYQEVWTNMGQAYKLLGDYPRAVFAYSQALELEPQEVLPRIGRAQAYDALGRSGEALADYDAALFSDPHQPLALANRAVIRYEAGDLPGALADMDRAVALSPDDPDFLCNRSAVLADLGRGDEAARDLRAALALPATPEAREEIAARLSALPAA